MTMQSDLHARGRPPVYLDYDQESLDRAYDQRAWAPNATELIARYAEASAAVRAAHGHHADLPYGEGADERLDWFPTAMPGAPIHIHLHGGAWRSQSKADVSFAAPAFTASGVHFVAPDFTNLPAVRMPEMVDQLSRAVKFVHRTAMRLGGDPDRIFISGHSSGAHLAAVLLTRSWPEDGLPAQVIKAGLCVGGSYDLEPVLLSSRRRYVALEPEEVLQLSPIRHVDAIGCPVAVAYGENESPEFVRQARSFAAALEAAHRRVELIRVAHANHFEVAEQFGRIGSEIHVAALAQISAHREQR